jgi:mannose-6-phosphate isomerase-like protein (cupin superfamily)
VEDGHSRARLDPGSSERFLALRRELGLSSFGLNQLVLQPRQRGRIHRHERQEEVYLVVEGTLTVAIEVETGVEDLELGEGELLRVAPALRRQLLNRSAERVVLVAIGADGEHRGRDGEAFESWESETGAAPQEVPLPSDLPVGPD